MNVISTTHFVQFVENDSELDKFILFIIFLVIHFLRKLLFDLFVIWGKHIMRVMVQ